MTSTRVVLTSLATFMLPITSAAQQDVLPEIPDVGRIITDPSFIHRSVPIPFLGGAVVNLYLFGNQYFYTPNPIAEWATFNEAVEVACADLQTSDQATVPLEILMYEDTVPEALAASVGVSRDLIGIVPSYGYSIFYRIDNDPAVLLQSTLHAQALLTGESLSGQINIPRRERVRVTDTCDRLRTIGGAADLLVSFHVLGQTFQTSRFSAEVLLSEAVTLELDADREEKQVDVTTVTVNTRSRGGGISTPFFSTGRGRSSSQTESSVNRYRTIDSDWVQDVVDRALTTIDIEKVCDQGACPDGDVPALLAGFLDTYVTEATATVAAQADGSLQLAINGLPTDLTVNVSEELKAQLDSLWQQSSSEETNLDVAGVEVGTKRSGDATLQLDNGVEWTNNGERWIPTSFKVRVLAEADLLRQLNLSYSSTVLDAAQPVSVAGGQEDPFSRDASADLTGPTLSERVAALEARQLSCEIFRTERADVQNHVKAEVIIPDGYVLAGGGCRAYEIDPGAWPFVTESGPLWDGRQGWFCYLNPVPNWGTSYTLEASAIGCLVE